MKAVRSVAILLCLLFGIAIDAQAQARLTVFISDVHMGLGRTSTGEWHKYEDFRWTEALKGFLTAISTEGNDRVDLVILGDSMELWQLPDDIRCLGSGAGAGCSVPELVDFAGRVVRAHKADFDSLRAFSVRGENRLHVVPGNHDAALLIPEVWAVVAEALGASSGRVVLVGNGIWRSPDKRVLAEHGHQIGSDVNRYFGWPTVTTPGAGGELLMIRPWGERFVQQLFNNEEARYPIIDNLSPESAGIRYLMADRGLTGSAADIARFLAFNIFETSLEQKLSALNVPAEQGAQTNAPAFDRALAIQAGADLFASSLPKDDPFRKLIEGAGPGAKEVRAELTELAKTLSDEDLQMLCQNALVLEKKNLCAPALAALAESKLVPKRVVFKRHFADRRKTEGDFEVFVYAHTHQWEEAWKVELDRDMSVKVINTGAFQRLVDEEGFLQRAKARRLSPAEALRQLRPEDLAPCYGVVVVKPGAGEINAKLRLWQMPESGPGRFREPGADDCK